MTNLFGVIVSLSVDPDPVGLHICKVSYNTTLEMTGTFFYISNNLGKSRNRPHLCIKP